MNTFHGDGSGTRMESNRLGVVKIKAFNHPIRGEEGTVKERAKKGLCYHR